MKTIAFHLQKGGTGKTTLSGTIAHELLNFGKNVLLIDADPQSNITTWFLENVVLDGEMFELAEIFQANLKAKDILIEFEKMYYIPSFGLNGELRLYGETKLHDEPFRFLDLIDEIRELKLFDYIIFDLSPSISRLEKSILMACDEVITPITPEFFSIGGLEIFNDELRKIEKNFRIVPKHEKIILNAFDERINQHRFIKESIEKLSYNTTTFCVDPAYRKAQAMHKAPQKLNLKRQSADAINKIALEIIRGV